LNSRVETGAVVVFTPPSLVDWGGTVTIFGGGEVQLPEPACGAAVFHNVDQTSRTVEQYDIIIALHTRGDPATAKTQKTNHHAAAAIMAKACSVAGVAAVAAECPDLALFVKATAKGVALLSSRLLVLDPGSIKPYFSQKIDELVGLRARLLGKADAASAAKMIILIAGKRRLTESPRQGPLKKMKQLFLEHDRRKKGVDDSDVQKEIFADGKVVVPSKTVNDLYAAYLQSIDGEGNLPWDELLPPGNERDGDAAGAEEEQGAIEMEDES